MNAIKYINITILSLLISSCSSVKLGPHYDEIDSNPKNSQEDSSGFIMKLFNINKKQEGIKETRHNTPVLTGDKSSYQEWENSKKSNTKEYQDFKEYNEWLQFKKFNRKKTVK